MISSCPNCMTQMEHEEHLFEIHCTHCNTQFTPQTQRLHDTPDGGPPPPGFPSSEVYLESSNAFQEIRDFGDSISQNVAISKLEAAPAPRKKAEPPSPKTATAPPKDCLITAGHTLDQYRIQKYLLPLSVLTQISPGETDPLKNAFRSLWELALTSGANAIVSLQIHLSNDATQALVVGTPVLCERES